MQNDMQEDLDNWTYTLRDAGFVEWTCTQSEAIFESWTYTQSEADFDHDHAKRAVMKQLCEINATF